MPFIGVPFVPFLGTDQIIEKGPSYHTGGVTTLMSVGDWNDDLYNGAKTAAIYGAGGYLAGKILNKSPIILALIGVAVGIYRAKKAYQIKHTQP